MDVIMVLLLMMVVAIPFVGIIAFLVIRKSFKNIAWIARQTGNDINDVIWMPDKFKVRYSNGTWEIQFQKMKERTQSVDGKFWTKFLKPKNVNKVLTYTKDEWSNLDMRQNIVRGIFFYENTEGELYPMTIIDNDERKMFSLVNQDNRQFIMKETQNVNALTKSKKQEFTLMIMVIIGIIVLGIVFLAGSYWQMKEHDSSIQSTTTLGEAYAKAVYNITCAGTPTYLSNVMNKPPGG